MTRSFQPWWVARAYLLSLRGESSRQLADQAYQTAIGLTTQLVVKSHLESVRRALAVR